MNASTVSPNTTLSGPISNASSLTSFVRDLIPLLPTYLNLLLSATFPIITAAHASLRRPPSARSAKKAKSETSASDDTLTKSEDDDSAALKVESLTISDAVLFPVLAGVTLTGLYLIIKWLEDPRILNKILGYYFSWIGLFFVTKLIKDGLDVFQSFAFPKQFSRQDVLFMVDEQARCFHGTKQDAESSHSSRTAAPWSVLLPDSFQNLLWRLREAWSARVIITLQIPKDTSILRLVNFQAAAPMSLVLTTNTALAAFSSLFIALYQSLLAPKYGTPWYLTNLIGNSFCYGTLQLLSPGSAQVGTLLLALLFFYDIYMVFYTPMMITVATKLDVPIKMVFPRPMDADKQRAMAMLGLGDIVIPGILIAFALRWDLNNYYRSQMKGNQEIAERSVERDEEEHRQKDDRIVYRSALGSWAERLYTSRQYWSEALQAKDFSKPYFWATTTGYVFGMVVTLVIMQIYKHGQPALLYLVPGVLGALWSTAWWRGEAMELWRFDEEQEAKEKEKREEQSRQETKTAEGKKQQSAENSKAKSQEEKTTKKETEEAKQKRLEQVKQKTEKLERGLEIKGYMNLFTFKLAGIVLKLYTPSEHTAGVVDEGASAQLQTELQQSTASTSSSSVQDRLASSTESLHEQIIDSANEEGSGRVKRRRAGR